MFGSFYGAKSSSKTNSSINVTSLPNADDSSSDSEEEFSDVQSETDEEVILSSDDDDSDLDAPATIPVSAQPGASLTTPPPK